jgi:orotate phosphoribosyltransferase-like protein
MRIWHERLLDYSVKPLDGGALVLWRSTGKGEMYQQVIRCSLPDLNWSVPPKQQAGWDHALFVSACSDEDHLALGNLMSALCERLLIRNVVIECYAMGMYSEDSGQRTEFGDILYQMKYCNKCSDGVENVVAVMAAFLKCRCPRLNAQYHMIVPVPSKSPVSGDVAERLGDELKMTVCIDAVKRKDTVKPMKDIDRPEEKENNIKGAFHLSRSFSVKAKRIIIVDDTIGSGATMRELGKTLRDAGAERVLGIAYTKNLASK